MTRSTIKLGFSLFVQVFPFQHMVRRVFRRAGKVQPEAGVQAEHVLLQFLRRRQGGVPEMKSQNSCFVRGRGGVRHGRIVAFPRRFPTRICDIEAVRADFWMLKGFPPD